MFTPIMPAVKTGCFLFLGVLYPGDRKRLFQMINDVPTVFEVVTGPVQQAKDQATAPNNNGKNKSSGRMVSSILYNLVFKLYTYEKENLCLYGLPNETWEVNLPAEEVPPELPEPALGINFARDGMQEKDWLSLVAVHSDSWLLSVAFYFGARFGFGKSERKRLFQMINDVPTVFEVVTGPVKQAKDQATAPNNNGKNKSSVRMQSRQSEPQHKAVKMPVPKEEDDSGEEEEDDEQGATLCGACGDNYGNDEFWICCDICERWFHGKCVKITPAKAEHIKQYKCPSCSSKRVKV
ncbi:unnamed protein product [Fraxinus pennsylvanica]|uniref:PHD finger protein ALFIN-LIKE n=1 Tax=Fraxinus pennsylvanica TaxID=56036 RepID=A0AAD2EBC8_9LAMI|nr:unnamed protein product [Fraxinus pennsylvanica]